MIEIREVRELLESELSNHGLQCKLTNQTDDNLGLQVSKRGYKTVLSITRYTHNPLEVEVNIDFAQAKQADIIRIFIGLVVRLVVSRSKLTYFISFQSYFF